MADTDLTARDRQICVLTAAGFTAEECAAKLDVSTRTVSRVRALPEAAAFIALKERDGVTSHDVLTAMLYSPKDEIRMRAAIELAKLPPDPDTHCAQSGTIVYAPPAPPTEETE